MNTETFQLKFQSVAVIAIVLSVISLIFVGVALIGPFESQSKKLKRKRIKVKRLLFLIVALLVLVTTAAIAFWIGTCVASEQVEHIWSAIDALASCIGALGTVAAIFAAHWVADRQNKIALFEKRYELYILVSNFDIFARLLTTEIIKTGTNVQMAFFMAFGVEEKLNDDVYIRTRCSAVIDKIRQLQFLYENINFQYVSYLMNFWKNVIDESLDKQQSRMSVKTIDDFTIKIKSEDFQLILNEMKKEMHLK